MATRTFRGTTNNNWNLATNWLEGAIPLVGDDVVFDASSPACTQDQAGGTPALLTFVTTGYNNTITLSNNITVTSTVTLSSTTTLSSTGIFRMVISGTTTVTSNGATISCPVLFNGNSTFTLGDSWTITGDVTCNGSALVMNANTVTCGASLSITGGSCTGTTSFTLNGTGTLTSSGTTGFANNLTINTAGTITFATAIFYYNTGTLTYTAGTVVTTSSTLYIGLTTTLNIASITWANVTFAGTSQTFTLSANLNLTGTFTLGGATLVTINGLFNINCASLVSSRISAGTSTIVMNGTGSWSGTAAVGVNLTFNTAGTITISTTVRYSNGTLKYTAGTMTLTSSILELRDGTTCILDCAGITWPSVTSGNSQTSTLLADFNVVNFTPILNTWTANGAFNINISGNFTLGAGLVFNGTATVKLTGTGTWSHASSTVTIANPVIIDSVGTITISGNIYLIANTFTYTAGTMVVTGSTMNFSASGATGMTLNVAGMTFENVVFTGTSTTIHTLSAALTMTGNLTLNNNSTTMVINGLFNITVGGSLAINNATHSGTASIVLNGTGTWSGAGVLRNNLTINTAGTLTVSGTVNYNTGTLTYTAGTVTTTSSTLVIGATGTTLNVSGITWNNVQYGTGTQTCTLSSDLNISGLLTFANLIMTVTINGAFSINCSGSVTHNNGASVAGTCLGLNLTGTGTYSNTGTAYQSFPLTINTAGTITFSISINLNATTFTYTAGTCIWTGSTLNTAGAGMVLTLGAQVINNLTMLGLATYTVTLSADLNVSGNTTIGINGPLTITGFTLKMGGSLTITNNVTISGTTNFLLNGTGTWSANAIGIIQNNLTINTAGTITVSGTVYFNTGTLTYTAGTMSMGVSVISLATCTIDTSGMTWFSMTFTGTSQTITLLSGINASGIVTLGGTTALTINGVFNFIISGSLASNTTLTSGTTNFVMSGTGTLSSSTSSTVLRNNLTINTAGTITIGTNFAFNTGTLTYTAGTVTTTSSTLTIAASCTLNTNGIIWNNITHSTGVQICTLSSNLNAIGTLTISVNTTYVGAFNITSASATITAVSVFSGKLTTSGLCFFNGTATSCTLTDIFTVGSLTINNNNQPINGSFIYVNGNFLEGTNVTKTGTSTIVLSGTGTWNNTSTAILNNPLTISGTYILSGVVRQGTGALIITSASTLNTDGSQLQKIGGVLTNNNSAITFNTIATTNASFDGDYGFSMNRFSCSTAGARIGWKSGNYYEIRTGTTIIGTAASPIVFSSSTPSSQAFLTLAQGAIQDIDFCNATDIDSSAGATVWSYKGVLTRTNNWGLMVAQTQLTNTY
ncbi:hypothetical protein KBD45_03500 [Candidatus Dojkabacteria bacterium]|nr:hypothetical protein [Candidatus Dojkabacteria bacterium]